MDTRGKLAGELRIRQNMTHPVTQGVVVSFPSLTIHIQPIKTFCLFDVLNMSQAHLLFPFLVILAETLSSMWYHTDYLFYFNGIKLEIEEKLKTHKYLEIKQHTLK